MLETASVAALFGDPKWLIVVGLALDIFAVVVLAWELVLRRLGPVAPQGGDSPDPPVTGPRTTLDRLKEQRLTIGCVILLVLGFALQIVGTWPR